VSALAMLDSDAGFLGAIVLAVLVAVGVAAVALAGYRRSLVPHASAPPPEAPPEPATHGEPIFFKRYVPEESSRDQYRVR
jgi:hypothetical protein